ncbi:MAG: IS3 family transposase [Gammaproteobacteria bacterium]|nr:IS3 family transposase [Gammaproteobacteria bacterium]
MHWTISNASINAVSKFETRQQAIQQITEYIELFYNRQRIQARLGYLSPAALEQCFYQHQLKKT